MPSFRSVDDVSFAGKTVLVRVDFNVPLDGGRVGDPTRIRESLPTIRKLVQEGARVVLCSHLGRPGGKRDPAQGLRPVAEALGTLLGRPVAFADDCVGAARDQALAGLKEGQVLLLENLRFHKEEEANDAAFAKQLVKGCDAFVNDAFGSAHRAHASTEGVARLLPSYAGLLMKKELEMLGAALGDPPRPFVAVLGGSKVSGKIDVIENLLPRVDALLIGGAMAFTFSKALGGETGDSLVENDRVELARRLLEEAKARRVELMLPVDVVASQDMTGTGATRVVPLGAVPTGWKGLDIGPATVRAYAKRIRDAQTVVANGPMGVFEVEAFAAGTCGVLAAMARCQGTTIVGGGDSAAAIGKCGFAKDVTHVSTGGGASLEFLEGKTLPGVAALLRSVSKAA